jgi:DNA-binding SARP family transcriptional activator
MLKIHFFGKSKIEYDGHVIGEQLGTKAYALICLLVLTEHSHLSRDKIIGYLWPDSNGDAARYNLRYNLWQIKKAIDNDRDGHPFLLVDKETCGINPKYDFQSDIRDVRDFNPSEDHDVEDLLKLKSLFQGEFLEGCYFKNCEAFNEWIIFERINFEKLKVKILKHLVDVYEGLGALDACLDTIQDIMEIEPYDEEMVEKRLDIYEACGNRTAAITYYNWFSNHLAGSLGVGPSESLRNKYQAIKSQVSDLECPSIPDQVVSPKCHKCIHQKGLVREDQKPVLIITSYCIEDLSFYWMSSVVESIIQTVDEAVIKKMQPLEVLSLSKIQPSVLNGLDHNWSKDLGTLAVKDVTIVNAFIHLLEGVNDLYEIDLKVENLDAMDLISKRVYDHILKFVLY